MHGVKNERVGEHLRQHLGEQADKAVVVVNEFAGEKKQGGCRQFGVQQLSHPLFEQGGLAGLPAAGDREYPRSRAGQPVDQGRAVHEGLALQLLQVRVFLPEGLSRFPLPVVGANRVSMAID